jgi:hypothetical protein
VTGPSSTPRGEHTPAPGATWETRLVRTETVIEDPHTTTPADINAPFTPTPNRETRRAIARAARRK